MVRVADMGAGRWGFFIVNITHREITMPRNISIIQRSTSSNPLNSQYPIGQYDFPFTFSPTIGCTFGCGYCFSPLFVAKVTTGMRKQFFENIVVKTSAPAAIDKLLARLADLPQHLKRVQINEATEYYTPELIHAIKAGTVPDVLGQVLEIFEKHWNNGNMWMLHILTKSHLVVHHIGILTRMRHMIQVEMSFMHYDDAVIRRYEHFTPSIQKRLDTIEVLAKAGIFVRTMAMPFLGDRPDAIVLRDMTFAAGARAFKHKGLNYFVWTQLSGLPYPDLLDDKVTRISGRNDPMFEDLMIGSGENIPGASPVIVEMPTRNHWDVNMPLRAGRLQMVSMPVIDCGYSAINRESWGYIK